MLRSIFISLLLGAIFGQSQSHAPKSIPINVYAPPELSIDHLLPQFHDEIPKLLARGIKEIIATSNDGHKRSYKLGSLGRVKSIVFQHAKSRAPAFGYRTEYEYDKNGRIIILRRYFKNMVGDVDSVIWAEDGRYFTYLASWMGNALPRKRRMTQELIQRIVAEPVNITDSTTMLQVRYESIEEGSMYLIDRDGRVVQYWKGDRMDSLYIGSVDPDTLQERWMTFDKVKGTSRIGMERILVRSKLIEERFYHDEPHMPNDRSVRWIRRFSYDHLGRLVRSEEGHTFRTLSTHLYSYDEDGLPTWAIRVTNKNIQYDQFEYYRTTQAKNVRKN